MLGICVVYLPQGADGMALLDRSVAQLQRTTRGPFRIYGCCPDNDAGTLRRLDDHGIASHRVGERHAIASVEHATLLNVLVDRAVADGCDHIATFDMDSWPVLEDWNGFYASLLTEATPVAAIVRTELGDNFPFAAFVMMRAALWHPSRSSFGAPRHATDGDDLRVHSSRPGETGSGILSQLHAEGRRFWRLERANAWNPHPVIAGIYDNTVFHLGAGSRSPRFITDEATYQIGGRPARRRFADRVNGAVYRFAQREVVERHDEFIGELTGGERRPLQPIETDPRHLARVLSWTPVGARTFAPT